MNSGEIQPEAQLNNNVLAISISIVAPTEETPSKIVSWKIIDEKR